MISISEVYVVKAQGKSKLCADVKGLKKEQTLWFAVEEEKEHLLCRHGGECFVLGLLSLAMQNGQELQYDGTLSKRFVHGVNEYLIPSMAAAREQYNKITVRAAKYGIGPHRPVQGVAMRFSSAEEFPATMEKHRKDSLYPLSYLCAFCEESEQVEENRRGLEKMVAEYGLQSVMLEQNLGQLYGTKTKDTESFLELAGVLALSGGLSIYLYYSENALVVNESVQKEEKNLDVIISSFASTDRMRIYLFDGKEELPC